MRAFKNISFVAFFTLVLFSCRPKNEDRVGLTVKFSKQTDSVISAVSKQNPQVDSLRQEIEAAQTDTAKLRMALETAKFLKYYEAIIIYRDVIDISKKIGFDDALFLASLGKEYYYSMQGEKDSAKKYFDLINEWNSKKNSLDIQIPNYIYYAIAYQKHKDLIISDSLLNLAINLIKKNNYKNNSQIARVYYTLGMNKNFEYDNSSALKYLNEAAKYAVLGNNYKLTGDIFFRVGECYLSETDYNNALQAYGNSIKYCSKVNDESTISSDLSAIGEIYLNKEDIVKAQENLFKSLKLAKKTKYQYQEAYTSATIGSLFQAKGEYFRAINFFEESNKIYKSYNNDIHSSEILLNNLNIGSVYLSMNDYDKALEYLNDVIKNVDPQYEPAIKAETENYLSDIYLNKNALDKAAQYAQDALKIADENEIYGVKQASSDLLYRVYEKKRDFEKALLYFKTSSKLQDSLTNKTQIKKFADLENEIKQNQLKREHDKKEGALITEKLQKEKELQRQRITSLVVAIGFVLILIFAVLIYRSLQDNKRKTKIITEQKKEVEYQKEVIEEKKKEVLDSISYAKKIQEAILPSEESIKKLFSESFVFYKPKDIVAGDFYWLEQINDTILIAAADCTGHGVPGAMVSVVCSNALNRAVKEFKLSDPGQILNKVREIVIDTFDKSGSEVKDGMDISLLALPATYKGVEVPIKWAGANNPLWYISEGQLTEIKANKQPVGKFINNDSFTTRVINLKKGDSVYLITDGFADQFGGPKGKKFKYKTLKDLLLQVFEKPMEDQKVVLNEIFIQWKNALEQVDDVTLIGIRV